MAGSYNHVVTDDGNLDSNERVTSMLENGGDVFEAVEELYGMIWILAKQRVGEFDLQTSEAYRKSQADAMKELVEWARENYQAGLFTSKEVHRLSPDKRRS